MSQFALMSLLVALLVAGASAERLLKQVGDQGSSQGGSTPNSGSEGVSVTITGGSGGGSSSSGGSGSVSQWGGSGGGGFCQGLSMVPTYHMEGCWLTGTVTINININIMNTFDPTNVRIKIVIFNGQGFTPMWTWAQCSEGFSNGQMQCYYRTRLPESGPGSNPSFWSGMQAYGFFGGNQCSSNMMPMAFGGGN